MADVEAQSEPVRHDDGSITWIVHYTDGTTIWFKWDPNKPPANAFTMQPVKPSKVGHGTLADGSKVETYLLPDGTRATQMGHEGGRGVDWITIHRKGEDSHWW